MKTIEEVFQNHYLRTGITQPELVFHLQVSQSTIHKWLSGKTAFLVKLYVAVCKLCSAPMKHFMSTEWFTYGENQAT